MECFIYNSNICSGQLRKIMVCVKFFHEHFTICCRNYVLFIKTLCVEKVEFILRTRIVVWGGSINISQYNIFLINSKKKPHISFEVRQNR